MTSPILTSRKNTPAVAQPTASSLDVAIAHAQQLASAGDMLPQSYRNKPGAILLVKDWADSHGVPLLTAMQTVAFVHGRPVIDATMQRALAQKVGYAVRVTEADINSATVQVSKDGEVIGSSTYTMADARTAGLTGKDNWKKNPEDMLVARATTRAIRRHAPDAMLGLYIADEVDSDDPVEILTGNPAPVATPEPVTVEAEIVDEATVTATALKKDLVALVGRDEAAMWWEERNPGKGPFTAEVAESLRDEFVRWVDSEVVDAQ